MVDTTGSMSDEISFVRDYINSLIDSVVGTENEPSEYILSPFNDPRFGPISSTNSITK